MPISKRTGRRYAAGSHKRLGGYEPGFCHVCEERIVLARGSAMHSSAGFSLCNSHLDAYGSVWASLRVAG